MLRHFGAFVALLAVLCGLSAAPYTHAHHAIDSVSDERHAHGATIVHTHASPHSHHDADDPAPATPSEEDRQEQVWSVDSFLFQQAVPSHAPTPVLVTFGEPHVQLTGIWLGAHPPLPRAHAPPSGSTSRLRAPPAFLPVSV